jgi:superfamily II RNA helicase
MDNRRQQMMHEIATALDAGDHARLARLRDDLTDEDREAILNDALRMLASRLVQDIDDDQ